MAAARAGVAAASPSLEGECVGAFFNGSPNAEARNAAMLDFVLDVSAKPGRWFLRPLIQRTPVPAPKQRQLAQRNPAEVSA